MDTTDAVIEAEVQLDGEVLRREGERRRESHGQSAVEISKPAVNIPRGFDKRAEEEEEPGEESPLLRRGDGAQGSPPSEEAVDEFAHLPWTQRPSIFWVLAPFFLMSCAFGGMIAPKINLILDLVCRQYISERAIWDPEYILIPVDFNDGDNQQCRIPEVQSRVSILMLWASLLAGGFSAITGPKLGALSDRYGRRPILMFTSIGTIIAEVITIIAGTYPESFPPYFILIAFAADGITGSFILSMAIANAYATDCTPPSRRNVAFGFFHGCLFSGIAIGPIIAGYVVKTTGRIVIVFWIMSIVHVFFITFIALFVPESLSKKRQMVAREKHRLAREAKGPNSDLTNRFRSLNLLEPLKVLWPSGPGSSAALRRNLGFLAAVDTIVFGVQMGSMTVIVTYVNYMFGWQSFESGRFMSIVNSTRVVCLLVILPLLTRFVRGKVKSSTARKATGSDRFDLAVIRFSVLFDTLGYLGYTLARTGPVMILSGCVAALGGIGSPTLQSSLTKHVPADQTGQLLGATSLLHALARVIAPAIFNAIYAETVATFPQTVFVCLAATFGLAFLISWCLKTNIFFDEDAANEQETDDHNDSGEYPRFPIVDSTLAASSAVGERLGLISSNQ